MTLRFSIHREKNLEIQVYADMYTHICMCLEFGFDFKSTQKSWTWSNSFFKILFVYFWLRWVFIAVGGLSLVTASGGYSLAVETRGCSLIATCGLLIVVAALAVDTGSRANSLLCLLNWQEGSFPPMKQLSLLFLERGRWSLSPLLPTSHPLRGAPLVSLQRNGISRTRNQTHVPCLGRWVPNHLTTREVPIPILKGTPNCRERLDGAKRAKVGPRASKEQSQ